MTVDLDIEGIDGPDHEIKEQDPGGFLALGGSRRKILLSAAPADKGPVKLEVASGGDKVDIYEGATGGDPLTGEDLEWDTPQEMPGQLWVQPHQISGVPGDVELKLSFEADYAFDAVTLTVCELQSLTTALIPANRERTTLGIGEPVLCYVHPFVVAHWECVGPGILEPDDGNAEIARFTASQSPSSSSVHATVGDLEFVLDFDVIAPNGMAVTHGLDWPLGPPGDNFIGVRTLFLVTVQPTTVCFRWADFRENIPEKVVTWPDGTEDPFGGKVVPWRVDESNQQEDWCVLGPAPIGKLWNGATYVPFAFSVLVTEQYKNDIGGWADWLDEWHPFEFSETQQTRTGITVDGHTEYGSWQGPYE